MILGKAGIGHVAGFDGTIPGDQNDGNLRISGVDLAGQFQSIHAFHLPIRHQNIELLLAESLQGVGGVVGADRPVALHLEDLAAQPGQHLVVVDK